MLLRAMHDVRLIRYLVAGLLCITQGLPVLFGQSSHQVFRHLTMEDGLSSNKVTDVIQDREGFYWIATQNGLNRFDGTTFLSFFSEPGNPHSLPHNHCTALLEDPDGNIWITTYDGLCWYQPQTQKITRLALPPLNEKDAYRKRLTNLSCDGDSLVWITGDGIWKYNLKRDQVTCMSPGPGSPGNLPAYAFVRHMVYDEKYNGWWLAVGDDLVFYDARSAVFYHASNNPMQWPIFEMAHPGAFALDTAGNVWFLDRHDLNLAVFSRADNTIALNKKEIRRDVMAMYFGPKGQLWISYWSEPTEHYDPVSNHTNRNFLQHYHQFSARSPSANGLYTDPGGHTWIYSGEGISIFQQADQYYKIFPFDLAALSHASAFATVYGIAQTEAGAVWLATDLGLIKYILESGDMQRIDLPASGRKSDKDQLPYLHSAVTAIASQGAHLYVGLEDRLIAFNTTTSQVTYTARLSPNIQFIRADDKAVWIGTWINGLYRIDAESGDVSHITASDDQASGISANTLITGCMVGHDLWLGYNGGLGFSKMNTHDYANTHWVPELQGKTNYALRTVTAVAGDRDIMWIGTYGSGLLSFDPKSESYVGYQQKDGLNSNYILTIFPDDVNRLWITTSDGLCVLDQRSGEIQPLDIDLGIADNDYVENGCRGVDGKLYFFQQHQVIQIDPGRFQPDTVFPNIVVSRFSVFDKAMFLPAEDSAIQLRYHQNFFSFAFSATKTQPDKRVRYAYRLEGFDPDWVETPNSYAGYTNVPPGTYRFALRMVNDAGQWSDVLWSREIVISPAFWKTWWWYSLLFILLGLSLYGIYRYRIRQLKKLYDLRAQISRDLHDDIGASLSSIHIYSSVAEEEISHDPVKTKTYLQQINANSRQVMEDISDIVWANRLQHDHHTSLDARIKNFGYDLLSQKKIDCQYAIDAAAEAKIINPEARRHIMLIIKEAMNNIAKYSEASSARIELFLRGKSLVLRIQDNGRGFEPHTGSQGNGLRHIHKRMERLGGEFDIASQPGDGTMLSCVIPIANISDN